MRTLLFPLAVLVTLVATTATAGAQCTHWLPGSEPAYAADPERGNLDWRVHHDFIVAGNKSKAAALVESRYAALQPCLGDQEYHQARLYADLSVLIAQYGAAGGWRNPDPKAPAGDTGRAVLSWQAHNDFATVPGRRDRARGYIVQRMKDLVALLDDETYARLYAQVATEIARLHEVFNR